MRQLLTLLSKKSGRDAKGHISVRHQGGRQKRFLREIDFKREKKDVWGVIESILYDPNRNSKIAMVKYQDGDRRHILAPSGLKEGDKVIASESAPLEIGNALPLQNLPAGTQIHNIEITPGKGGQIVKSAGGTAQVLGKEENYVLVRISSGETRRFNPRCWATIGQVGNIEIRTRNLGKAGAKRHMGIRPSVRGIAMHPAAHPHGGGEGRSGIGMKYPKTPYGKPAVGKTRKHKKYSNKLIVKPRKKGPHVG